VIALASKLKLTVVPVLDEKKQYLGLITQSELLHYFAELLAVKNPGGIIVLELNQNDYSLSQIAQIVEGNDAKILGLYVSSSSDTTKMDVTIKINRTDLSAVLQTFARYNYTVKASYLDDNTMDSLYSDRYDQFMRYLSI
jgi:hypothetical protein